MVHKTTRWREVFLPEENENSSPPCLWTKSFGPKGFDAFQKQKLKQDEKLEDMNFYKPSNFWMSKFQSDVSSP